MIEVEINGLERAVPPGLTVITLLDFLDLNGQPLLVEHNGRALLKSEWAELFLQKKDRIELVRVVAGG